MYLMYVDESGDSGLIGSPSNYFILSGLVIHETFWHEYLDKLIQFRKEMKNLYGLDLKDEIHAQNFILNPGRLYRIKRYNRLAILRHFADQLATMDKFRVLTVIVSKDAKTSDYDIFDNAWRALIQRFENTITHKNLLVLLLITRWVLYYLITPIIES